MGWRVGRILLLLAIGLGLGWWVHRPSSKPISPVDAAVDRVVPTIRFRQQPFERVLAECERVSRVPIVVDWSGLAEIGVSRQTPVTLHRYDTRLGDALERIVEQLGGDDHALTVSSDWDRIIVRPDDGRTVSAVVRVRHVGHLLRGSHAINIDFVANDSFGGPPPLFGPGPPTADQDREGRRREELLVLVKETIDPDSWRDNGGLAGDIRLLDDHLLVVQTVENQERVSQLLAQLVELGQPSDAEWPGPASGADDAAWEALLARRAAGDVRLDGVPLERALDRLREAFRANLEMDPELSDASWFNPAMSVTMNLARPTLEEALQNLHAPDEVGRHWFGLKPDREGDGIVLCAPLDAERTTVTRLYDFRPLLDASPTLATFKEFAQEVQAAVAEGSWRDQGGPSGALRQVYPGRAYVTQTREHHRMLRAWLDDRLAEARAAGKP